jgi:hypothetical protein
MKKAYSEDELKELANSVFEQYPSATKVFATVDGNVFLEENRANIHAGAKGRVLPFNKPLVKEEKADKKKTPLADDQIKAIAEVTKLEDLEVFKTDGRATVVKALQDKTAELTAANTGV